MAVVALVPSQAQYAEASQIIGTLNTFLTAVNTAIAPTFAANTTVATVLGSLGPAGSHTTVQKWLTVQDPANGALFYAPLF